MQVPFRITFRHTERTDEVETRVRRRVEKLDQLYGQIMSGHAVIDLPQHRQRKGKLFHVRIDLTVPGKELVVNRDPQMNQAHENLYVAVDDAFDIMERKLREHSREMQGEVKEDVGPERGIVEKLFVEEGYGFIQTRDGRDVYFHRNSVLNGGFDRLRRGVEVRFSEEEGEKGPQASTVYLAGG